MIFLVDFTAGTWRLPDSCALKNNKHKYGKYFFFLILQLEPGHCLANNNYNKYIYFYNYPGSGGSNNDYYSGEAAPASTAATTTTTTTMPTTAITYTG
jgi:hypothetical protein